MGAEPRLACSSRSADMTNFALIAVSAVALTATCVNAEGPYALQGYFPLFSSAELAELGGNGESTAVTLAGETHYLADPGVQYTGNYGEPFDINGYFPLWTSEADAQAAGDGTSVAYTFDDIAYYMPQGDSVTQYTGDYEQDHVNCTIAADFQDIDIVTPIFGTVRADVMVAKFLAAKRERYCMTWTGHWSSRINADSNWVSQGTTWVNFDVSRCCNPLTGQVLASK